MIVASGASVAQACELGVQASAILILDQDLCGYHAFMRNGLRKICLVAGCALAAWFGAMPSGAAELRLITEDNPPFNFIDQKTGEISGVAHELVVQLMEEAGVPYRAEMLPWHRGYRLAMETANTCIYGINRTHDREELFKWIGPLFDSGWAFYSYDPSIRIEHLSDITDQIVAVKAGDAVTNAFMAARPDARVLTVETDRMGVRLLHHGRADLWLTGVAHALKSAEIMKVPVPRQVFLWRKSVIYMACSRDTDSQMVDRIRAALPSLEKSRDQIIHKYR